MAFEGLREQLKDQWADLSAKIQETPAYNNLREKFESQTPPVQRAIVLGGTAFVVLFLLSFPFGYWSQSSDNMTLFDENRELIQGLLLSSRSAKTPSPLPPPLDTGSIRARVDGILKSNRLLPEQLGEISDLPGPAAGQMVPASVVQNGIAVQVKKLNLTQIVTLANQFQNMGGGTKLMGLDVIQSPGQTHYYDMIAKVVNFGLPAIADSEGAPATEAKGKGRPNRPARNARPSRPADTEPE